MNNFNNTRLIWLLVVLMIINIAAAATMLYLYFNPPEKPLVYNKMMYPPNQRKLDKLLEFDEEQTEMLRQLRKDHRQSGTEVRREIRKSREELINEITAVNPDTLRIRALSHQLGKLYEQMQIQLSNHLISIRSICDETQVPRFDSTLSRLMFMETGCGGHRHHHPKHYKNNKPK